MSQPRPHSKQAWRSGEFWRLCIRSQTASLIFLHATARAVEPPAGPEAFAANAALLDEIIVTGSRIPTAASDETLPVTVLDGTDLARGGLDALSKTLQTLPASATSVRNTNVNNGGDGSARVDLRALSPKRTLVLLNGHRFPDGGIGGDDSVDLNSLPTGLIDHVEVLTSGASAVYGADAVAGVVNVITKSSFNGLELSAVHSQTESGDGQIGNFNLNAGHDIFGGHWMFGGQYVNQSGVTQSARAFSAVPVQVSAANGDTTPAGSATLPEGVFDVPAGNALGLTPGYYTHITGALGRGAADYRPENPDTDILNTAPYQLLQTPNARASAWLIGTQPLTADIRLHVEALFNHRTSNQLLAPTPFSTAADPSPTLADGSQGIPADNAYNPFGVDLEDARRRFVEIPDRSFNQRVEMSRELASLNMSLGAWSVEPAIAVAHSIAAETDLGAISAARLVPGLGPSGQSAQGQLVCGTPNAQGIVPASNIITGCVPIDIFSGAGSLTPQQINYLRENLEDHGTNGETIASINGQGPLGAAWAGPIQWATGAEYRRETGSYLFDPSRGAGAIGSGGQEQDIPPVAYSAREVYLEMRTPLVRHAPLVEALDLSVGIRYSDFSSFGGHLTWQSSLRWQPLAAVSLRSSYARVFRAPSLSELYVVQGAGLDLQFDPCGNNPSPTQRAHCASNGVPGGAYVQSQSVYYSLIQGGNSRLAPESGYSFDTGIEFRPPDLSNFMASLDAYRIALNGSIEVPDDEDVLQQCADLGRADACGLIKRNADGSIAQITGVPQNLGRTLVSGLDATATWLSETAIGRFKLSLQTSYLARHDTQIFSGGPVAPEAGTFSQTYGALPRWRSLAHTDFDRGTWHLGYSLQWIGGYNECDFVSFQDDEYCRRVDTVFYHDIEAAYTVRGGFTARLGISNITNRQPPFLAFGNEANTDTSAYRLLGRTFFVAFRYTLL